jgi:hypothetical protein
MKNGTTIMGKGSRLSGGGLLGRIGKDLGLWRQAMETKWQIGPVKLVNGEDAFIDAINEDQEDNRYTGRVRNHAGKWIACGWHDNGRFMFAGKDHKCNLAPPPKKTVRVKGMWVVVLYNHEAYYYYSEEAAEKATRELAVFAIRKLEPFEVTEGEGL